MTDATTTLASAAGVADTIIKDFMKIEPFLATASNFIPGAAPIVAIVHPAVAMAAPFVEQALEAVASGNNGNAFSAFIELLQHITPGQPNSPILSAPAQAAITTG